MIKYVLLTIISGILSAISQIILKKSSGIPRKSKIKEYLNPYVISGYGITFLCMILMILAYRGLPYKYGAVMESLVYVHIMILSKLILKERITLKKVIGNSIIILGIIIFSI